MARLSVYLPDDLYARLLLATRKGEDDETHNVSSFIQSALRQVLPARLVCTCCGQELPIDAE